MNKKKTQILNKINKYFNKYKNFYIIDISKLKSMFLFNFRKNCINSKIKLINIKNNLLKKYLLIYKKKHIHKKVYKYLVNSTFLMFTNSINIPAKIINENKILINNKYYPIFKGAYIEDYFYVGEDKINYLLNLKSKENIIINILFKIKFKIINFIYKYKNYYNYKIYNIINKLNKNEKN